MKQNIDVNKIWMVSEMFYPDEATTGFFMTKIAKAIAEIKEINVICGPIGYDSYSSSNSPNDLNNIKIHRIKIRNLDKNNLVLRVIRMFLLTFKMFFYLIRRIENRDQVIIVTNPATNIIFIGLLRSIKKFNLTIIVHDVFPENLLPSGIIKENTLIYKLLLKIFNSSYKRADKIIVVGEDMKILLNNKLKFKNKIEVIQNWADLDSIYNLKDRPTHEIYYGNPNFKDKIVIQFAGNIGRVQGLENLLTLLAKISNSDLVFVIIGEGALKEKLMSLKDNLQLSNVFFYPSKMRNEQLVFLNQCDIGLVTLKPGMFGLGVPSKSYNILAAGKPILYIGDPLTEIALLINEHKVGYAFSWDQENEIVNFLNSVKFENKSELQLIGIKARQVVENLYSFSQMTKRYQQSIIENNN